MNLSPKPNHQGSLHIWTILFVLVLSQQTIGRAATIEVSHSIGEALSKAQAGDTLLISGLTVFHEHLTISNSVKLIGRNAPVIDAEGSGTPITIMAPDVVIEGLTIRNSGRDLTRFDSAVMIAADGASVRHCRISNDGFGVYLRGVGSCRIEANEIAGSTNLASAARGNGIHLWKSRDNEILSNAVHDKRDGMYFSYADNNLIAGNRVWDTRFGIHYMYSHENRLLTNALTKNAVGATLMFSRQSLVQGNIVSGNRRHGMLFKQLDNSRILNNVVCGQNRGFFIQQAAQNLFEGNLIATNDIGIYLSNCSEQNVFSGNAFIRNTDQIWQPPFETEQGRNAPNKFSKDGKGNYWSDYTGADRNHDGIGDTAYHETDVFGYIIDRHPQARVFAMSPALALLRKGEEVLPLLDTAGVTDPAPLMNPSVFTRR
jgi:nitrous oxidase accessory protein